MGIVGIPELKIGTEKAVFSLKTVSEPDVIE